MYCTIYLSFRRSRTYSRSISEYIAAHSLCVGTSWGAGMAGATGQRGRGTNSGSVIVVGMTEHREVTAWNFFFGCYLMRWKERIRQTDIRSGDSEVGPIMAHHSNGPCPDRPIKM